jgi:predicted phage tail protein
MRDVFLHGNLGEQFGHQHRIEVDTVAGICWAMESRQGGFFKALKHGSYQIYCGNLSPENALSEVELPMIFHGDAPFHMIPAIEGSGSGGAGKAVGAVVLGIVIIATAGAGAAGAFGAGGALFGTAAEVAAGTSFASWESLALFGGVLALSGVSQLMAATPKVDDYSTKDKADEQKSFLFNGPVNTIEQGTVLPVVFGRHMIGSTVISAGIRTARISAGGTYSSESGDGIDNPIPGVGPETLEYGVQLSKVNESVSCDASALVTLSPVSGDYVQTIGSPWDFSVSVTGELVVASVYVNGDLFGQVSWSCYNVTPGVSTFSVNCFSVITVRCNDLSNTTRDGGGA